MLVLRVRCVDDGSELLLERHGADEQSVQVAELKRLVLQQRSSLCRDESTTYDTETEVSDLGDFFLLLRGQILADPDIVDLNALGSADFFIFATDASPSLAGSSSGGGLRDTEAHEMLKRQLQDMGFPAPLAARALQQTGNNLPDAAILLADGKVNEAVRGDATSEEKTEEEEDEIDLMKQYPSIAPLGNLVNESKMRRLHELAATDSFQAMLLLKEHFESQELTQLNENPVATLQLLSLPASRLQPQALTWTERDGQVIDRGNDDGMAASSGGSDDAIDRLVAMGFERDLVQAMYESCGNDEQLTANALLQTLES